MRGHVISSIYHWEVLYSQGVIFDGNFYGVSSIHCVAHVPPMMFSDCYQVKMPSYSYEAALVTWQTSVIIIHYLKGASKQIHEKHVKTKLIDPE